MLKLHFIQQNSSATTFLNCLIIIFQREQKTYKSLQIIYLKQFLGPFRVTLGVSKHYQ